MAKFKYTPDIARKMYAYFLSYDGGSGIPSFSKFARSIGTTLARLEQLRKYKKFDEAYCECSEIRRDYLIDAALTKRHDASFTKYLLEKDSEDGASLDEITLRVIE